MALTQDGRLLAIDTPLGPNVLVLQQLTGWSRSMPNETSRLWSRRTSSSRSPIARRPRSGASAEKPLAWATESRWVLPRTPRWAPTDSLSAGQSLTITVADQVLITTGQASILMKRDGTITIEGSTIALRASGDIILKGSKIVQN